MRWCALPILIAPLASACASSGSQAYLYQKQDEVYLLDDGQPARAWNVRVSADQLGDRTGDLWCTLHANASLVADDHNPWHDFWVDLWLKGGDLAEQHLQFLAPGTQGTLLVEHLQNQCQPNQPCEWDFRFSAERRMGTGSHASNVTMMLTLQAIVVLGDPKGAPKDARLFVSVNEDTGYTGDTGQPSDTGDTAVP